MAAATISSLLNQEFPKVVFLDHYYLRIIYMKNGIPNAIANSWILFFADDVKCFKHIKVPSDIIIIKHNNY